MNASDSDMAPRRPSQLLEAWIHDQLRVHQSACRMPTDRELAERFGLSVRTVRRVFARFREEKRLRRVPGMGTAIVTESGFTGPPRESWVPVHRSVAQQLYRLICSGTIRRGMALPSVKSLRLQFHISSATAAAAYRDLLAKGAVTRIGKTYWAGSFDTIVSRGMPRVVQLFTHQADYTDVFLKGMLARAYRGLEQELADHGFHLEYATTADARKVFARFSRTGRPPAGIVLCDMTPHRLAPIVAPLERYLSRARDRAPRVLVDWNSGTLPSMLSRQHVLSHGNVLTAVARALARYLVETGHADACFFLDDRQSRTMWYLVDFLRVRTELLHLDPRFRFRLFVITGRSIRHYTHLERFLTEPAQSRVLSKYDPADPAQALGEIALVDDFRGAYRANRHDTVWVFSEADHAAQALDWAAEHRVEVPDRLGIVTLEDAPRHYVRGISFCGPDWERTGYLMAHALIGDFPVERSRQGFIRTGARVVDKRTTWRAR